MSETHDDLPAVPDGGCGDAAIYLLGLLDERHAAAFLDHVRGCAVCGDELGALAPAVDILPATVPQMPAPAHVKRQVMAIVRAETDPESEPQAQRSAVPTRPHPARRPRLRGVHGWRRQLRELPRPALALLACAALLAAGVAIGTLTAGGPAATQEARVVSADVTLAGASAALHQSAGHAWLTVAGMPQPPSGRVYEVWIKRPGGAPQPTSSLFTPTASGKATVAVPGDLAGASEVMVTQEPAGGSQVPTSLAVIVAHLV